MVAASSSDLSSQTSVLLAEWGLKECGLEECGLDPVSSAGGSQSLPFMTTAGGGGTGREARPLRPGGLGLLRAPYINIDAGVCGVGGGRGSPGETAGVVPGSAQGFSEGLG